MLHIPSSTDLGEADLTVAGLHLWVDGRQNPESNDYYDGNWLRVTAHCYASRASVWAQGAILMATDIAGFGNECAAMLNGQRKSVVLNPFEPEIKVSLEASDRAGHIRAKVEITPDHLLQAHRFKFEIDQSYLPGIIKQCSDIVQVYQIRGE